MFRLLTLCCFITFVKCQLDLEKYFGNCHKNSTHFDTCVKDALNELRPYYKVGIPELGVLPLDPFYLAEVTQKMSNPLFNYKLVLRNVTESGWTVSEITRFRTDFNQNFIQYTQVFPDKKLHGVYEIVGTFFGTHVSNQGTWNLGLYDYQQTTTVTRKPIKDKDGKYVPNPPLKVKVTVQSCKKLELHISHLAGGRTIVENMLDRIINTAWQPGFIILSPLINDLVSTGFTEIFNTDFQNFPFDQVFPY